LVGGVIVITDSNIIFSALISPNGVVASIFTAKSNLQFYAPSYLFEEVDKHIDKIVAHSPLSKKEILERVKSFKKRINIIKSVDVPQKYRFEAISIVSGIDLEDAPFVALNRYTKHKLWTSDEKLIKGVEAKGYNIFITTKELRKKLYKKK
jgi:predicted nucleic acid-binding protein